MSLLAALVALQLTGATINTMILAGLVLALGVVIDDAVIDVERLLRRLRERGEAGGLRSSRSIYQSTLETRSAAIYAALIVVLAVMPDLLHGRRVGRVLRAAGARLPAGGAGVDAGCA